MKKLILYIFLSFLFLRVAGQRIEFSGGLNNNRFFSSQKDGGHLRTNFNNTYSYSLGIGLEDIKLDTLLKFRIILKFDNYRGSIHTINGGLAGESTTNATVDKYIVGLGVYPLNFNINKKIRISLGGEINYLIAETESGYQSSWQIGQPDSYKLTENGSITKNSRFNFGLLFRIGYDIRLKKDWYIVPQYIFYRGLTEEFKNIEAPTMSLRHYLQIGIIKQLR
ncbi:MAG: outer membrane beta-barrel protein [Bacteroidales bacterium]|nr:outer membrane beta-barrel protein [Bacteroidales bacterium]